MQWFQSDAMLSFSHFGHLTFAQHCDEVISIQQHKKMTMPLGMMTGAPIPRNRPRLIERIAQELEPLIRQVHLIQVPSSGLTQNPSTNSPNRVVLSEKPCLTPI